MQKENKTLIKNIISLGFVQIINYLLPLISIPIVSRIIGVENLGAINFVSAFVNYFTIIISYGFDLTATRKVAVDPTNVALREKVYNDVLNVKFVLLVICTLLYIVIIYFVNDLNNELELCIYLYLLCVSTLLSQNWFFQAMQELTSVALLNLLSKLSFIILIVIYIKEKDDYVIYGMSLGITSLLTSIISLVWINYKYSLHIKFVNLKNSLKVIVDERKYFFSLFIINLYTTTNIFLLGLISDETNVGLFSASQKIIVILTAILTLPLRQSLFPYLGKILSQDYEKGIIITKKFTPIITYFVLFISILTCLLSDWIIYYIYGEKFHDSALSLRIMSFIPLIITLSSVFGLSILMNLGKDDILLKITLYSSVLSILLNIFLIKSFGYIGVSITWTLSELLTFLLIYMALKKEGLNLISLEYFKPFFVIKNFKLIITDFIK